MEQFLADLMAPLGQRERRHWGSVYVRGLLLDGERKSIKPMAARLPEGNVQAMQQLIGQSPWPCSPVWQGLAQRMTAELAPDPVWVIDDTGFPKQGQPPHREVWLLVEWPPGEKEPTKYFLCDLPESDTPRRLVRIVEGRWKIEQDYQQLKEELDLDRYEGRHWTGWHHHVTLVMLAHAFLTLERLRSKINSGDPATDAP